MHPTHPPHAGPQRYLQLLGFFSIAVPIFIFALFGTTQFIESRQEAELRVNRSLRVAHEHASKVINGAEELADRIHDLIDGKSNPDLLAEESRLYNILREKTREQPQLQSIWILGADGKPIASSRFATVDRTLSFLDRDYMQYFLQGNTGRFVSQPLITKTSNEKIVNLSIRFNGPDGSIGGVICISLMTNYFRQFYEDLADDEPGLAIRLLNEDKAVYTSYPNAYEGAPVPNLHANGVNVRDGAIYALKKLRNYPLYVETAMDLVQVRNAVLKQMGLMLAFGLPPFAALFFTARVAQRRSRETLEAAIKLDQEVATRRKAEDALLQAQKLEAMGRLTGGVAHDFNNALMVINNNVFLLKRYVSQEGQVRLEAISRAVRSATKLTRQLLAFSRRQALVPEVLRLQDKLPLVKDLVGPVLGSQVNVSVVVASDTQLITADAAELELALLNLAINARDAMPSGGSFSISARNANGEMPGQPSVPAVAVCAVDSGSGIDATVLDHVFEPFFTTKPVGEGTGLGLSQVYGMCQRAGGVATIHSVVGSGTQVTLYFPATAAELASDNTPSELGRDLGKAVLVVEDNDDVAGSLVLLLEALGCTVTRVNSAASALEWLDARKGRNQVPDLVLTDVVMPGDMDGLALARHLRATWPELPLLLMTGYSRQVEEIVQQGFEVLPKPCSAEQLNAAILRKAKAQEV